MRVIQSEIYKISWEKTEANLSPAFEFLEDAEIEFDNLVQAAALFDGCTSGYSMKYIYLSREELGWEFIFTSYNYNSYSGSCLFGS